MTEIKKLLFSGGIRAEGFEIGALEGVEGVGLHEMEGRVDLGVCEEGMGSFLRGGRSLEGLQSANALPLVAATSTVGCATSTVGCAVTNQIECNMPHLESRLLQSRGHKFSRGTSQIWKPDEPNLETSRAKFGRARGGEGRA